MAPYSNSSLALLHPSLLRLTSSRSSPSLSLVSGGKFPGRQQELAEHKADNYGYGTISHLIPDLDGEKEERIKGGHFPWEVRFCEIAGWLVCKGAGVDSKCSKNLLSNIRLHPMKRSGPLAT